MFKLNNRGQMLVMFVIFIPIVLLILTLVYDIGSSLYEKERLNNVSNMAIDYGLDNISNIDENDLISLIMENTNDMKEVSVNMSDNSIYVKLSKDIKGVMGNMLNFKVVSVTSEYKGSIISNKKKIERIK